MNKFKLLTLLLIALVILACLVNLQTGYAKLSLEDFYSSTAHSDLAHLRENRVLAILLAGVCIPTAGFLLQEYFGNPLAGPSVLGINSVASLGVAFCIFLSKDFSVPEVMQNMLLSGSAIAGSLALMVLLIMFSGKFRDKNFIIIFGFLISALAGAVISVLEFYGDSQSLKNYTLWSFGGNAQLSYNQLITLSILALVGLIISFRTIRPLIGNILGEAYAKSFGLNLNSLKINVIIASSILSASVTAFIGPVLFIGIVVPHFSRMLYNPAKLWQQWILNMVLGIFIMQVFSIISELSQFPINIISSLFGIPVILTMMLKDRAS